MIMACAISWTVLSQGPALKCRSERVELDTRHFDTFLFCCQFCCHQHPLWPSFHSLSLCECMLLLFVDRVFATATAGSRMGIWQKEDSRPLDFCQWQFELEVAPASSCEGGLNVYCPVTVWRQRRRHRSAVVLFFSEDKFGRAALLQCVPVSRWEQKPSRIRLLSLVFLWILLEAMPILSHGCISFHLKEK